MKCVVPRSFTVDLGVKHETTYKQKCYEIYYDCSLEVVLKADGETWNSRNV